MVVDFNNLTKEQSILFSKQKAEVVDQYNRLSEVILMKRDSLSWYLNNVTSRNTNFSNLLYWMRCIKLLETLSLDSDIESVYTNDHDLANCLSSKYNVICKRISIKGQLLKIYKIIKTFFFIIFWILGAIKCKSKSRREKHAIDIDINIDIFCERVDPKFTDRYYGDIINKLPDSVKKRTAFVIQYLPRPKKLNIEKIAATSPISVIYWWDYLAVSDYFSSLINIIKCGHVDFCYSYCSHNISGLLKKVAKDNFDPYFFFGFLYERFIFRLKSKNVRITKYVDWYENQSFDRAFYWAMHKYYPNTKTAAYLGFINDVLSTPHIIANNTELEKHIAPQNIFVCNQMYKDLLHNYRGNCDIVPFYRSQQVWSVEKTENDGNKIIVLVPMGLNDYEVKFKVNFLVDAMNIYGGRDVVVLLKPHPSYNAHMLQSLVENVDNIQIVNGNIYDYLVKATFVIAANSTTTYEALALKIPIIQLVDRQGILEVCNPLSNNEMWFNVRGSSDFIKCISKNLTFSCDDSIRQYFFCKETDDNILTLFE